MRKIFWPFLVAAFTFTVVPLAAQVSYPGVRYVSVAPSGACSQAPPVQVLNSSGAIYTCKNGTWSASGGTGSGTVTSATAGQIAGYGATGTTVVGVSPYAPLVTDPPYNAVCDSVTNDTAAIQAALDDNDVVRLPNGGVGCVITSLTFSRTNQTLLCNESYLMSSITSGKVLSGNIASLPNYVGINNCTIEYTALTGTPTGIDLTGVQVSEINGVTEVIDHGLSVSSIVNTGGAFTSATIENGSSLGTKTITGVGKLVLANNLDSATGADTTLTSIGNLLSTNNIYKNLTVLNSVDVTLLNDDVISPSVLTITNAQQLNAWGSFSSEISAVTLISRGQLCTHRCYFFSPYTNAVVYSAAGTAVGLCGAPEIGTFKFVSDATVPTYLGVYVPGGAVYSPVFCNGTNWITY